MNDKFQYPIYEDRLYTLDLGLVKVRVFGSLLIKAYKAYMVDEIPSDIYDDDDMNKLF